ncbi:hypothetical protein OCH239_12370 [Roseivivax halodurans JCM 10272]|uniref:Uncharacterized protein n=2 Tax=Roseivivax halodurans TaxID=93683 RepID=X7EDM9_9RHOB|nr:hypothetical protein OCH239_12370 [Roseivivax halodurans JCM 10272]
MGVSYTDGPALAPSGELRADIGRLSYLIGLRDASTAKAQQFIAPLYEGEGSRMVDALMSGSSASLTIDTVEGQIRHNITLNGSARAMRPILKACPDPDLEWDPSDAPAGSTNQPSAGAELVSDRNEIAQTFLRQNCVATESELFEAVRQRWGSIGDAHAALRIWGETPGFSDDYEILSRDPFTYRWTAGPCANSLQRAATEPPASPQGARDQRVAEAIDRACWRDDGGTMDRGIYTPDLDGDGRDDLVLDHAGIACSQGYLPQTCGAQVCETQIFFGFNGGYREGHTMLNSVTEVVPGTPPGLRIIGHGGTEGVVRWNGREFAVQ